MKAVVLGATGAVGSHVVRELLRGKVFTQVTILVRRQLVFPNSPPAGLVQHVVDVFDPTSYQAFLAGHAVAFCTLGIGQPSKVSKEELHRVDVECAAHFALACRGQGILHFTLMTAVGANPNSPSYYLRMKGELEEQVKGMGFERVSIFRPSLLVTPENRYGFVQGVVLAVFPKLEWILLGPLRKYRSIKVENLGLAMVRNAVREGQGVEVLERKEFGELLR